MNKKEILQLNDDLIRIFDWLKRVRVKNDDLVLQKEAQKIVPELINLLKKVVKNEQDIKEYPDIITNIENVLKLYFMDINNIIVFISTRVRAIELYLVSFIFTKEFQILLDNINRYFSFYLIDINFIHKLTTVLYAVVSYLKIVDDFDKSKIDRKRKDALLTEKYREQVAYVFKDYAKLKDKKLVGEIFLLILYCHIAYLPLKVLLDVKSDILECLKQYLYASPYFYHDQKLVRLLEVELINQIWVKDRFTSSTHYTTLEGLFSILTSRSLKFTKLTNLNDKLENKALRKSSNNDIFTFSMTHESDSMALFGNYTNFEGIAIELDAINLYNSMCGVYFEWEDKLEYVPMDFNSIRYKNNSNAQKEVDDITQNIFDLLEPYVPRLFLKNSFDKSHEFLNYFYKKKPWSYEGEIRMAINIPKKLKKKPLSSGTRTKDNSICLSINPERLFTRIILGPKILNNKSQHDRLIIMLKDFGLSDKITVDKTQARMNFPD